MVSGSASPAPSAPYLEKPLLVLRRAASLSTCYTHYLEAEGSKEEVLGCRQLGLRAVSLKGEQGPRRCSLVVSLGSRPGRRPTSLTQPPFHDLLQHKPPNWDQGMPNQTLTATGPARVEMGAMQPRLLPQTQSRDPASAGARHRGSPAFPDPLPHPWPPAAQSCECGARWVDTSLPSLPGTQPQGQKQPLGVTSPAASAADIP